VHVEAAQRVAAQALRAEVERLVQVSGIGADAASRSRYTQKRWISEMFPIPPLTRNQVELMQIDTVSSPEMPGFDELGISPHPVAEILR
jgi:hypothetical protein